MGDRAKARTNGFTNLQRSGIRLRMSEPTTQTESEQALISAAAKLIRARAKPESMRRPWTKKHMKMMAKKAKEARKRRKKEQNQ